MHKKIIAGVLSSSLLLLGTNVMAANMKDIKDVYKAKSITIDADLSDWDAYQYGAKILPEKEEQVSHFSAYAGPEDLSIYLWYAWSDVGLYLAAEVIDNVHHTEPAELCWMGDSLQLSQGLGNGFGPEINFSTDAVTYVNGAVSDAINIKTKVDGTVSTYEMLIPWSLCGGGRPADGLLPFCVCVNENDGTGRAGWIETAPGIAAGKQSHQFGVLNLLEEEPKPADDSYTARPKIKNLTEPEAQAGGSVTVVYELNTYITYPDIQNHWAKEAIEQTASMGVLRGYGEFFQPSWGMTQAEFLAALVRAVDLDLVEYRGELCNAPQDAWYATYLQTAADGHLIPAGFFNNNAINADAMIRRDEMIALVSNAYLQLKNQTLQEGEFPYADGYLAQNVTLPYLKNAQAIGLIQGDGASMLRPTDSATRAEVAVMLNQLIKSKR
ncbi:MAG: hypothetical protein E7397_06155 [Ruminococcaceae bacterium]|nr:hypothetical protein [Oscillospiraceae bacterium]